MTQIESSSLICSVVSSLNLLYSHLAALKQRSLYNVHSEPVRILRIVIKYLLAVLSVGIPNDRGSLN